MRKRLLAAALLCGASLMGGELPISETVRIDSLVPVAMRDGVRLYADIYRPGRVRHDPVGGGPTLVQRKGGNRGRKLPGARAVAGRERAAAEPGDGVPRG